MSRGVWSGVGAAIVGLLCLVGCTGNSGSGSTGGTTAGSSSSGSSGSGSPGAPSSIQFLSAVPATISVAGGWVSSSRITFEVLDAAGRHVADGVEVSFSSNSQTAPVEPLTAKTAGGSGEVETVLKAGNLPESVVVTAAAGAIVGQSTPITIAGAGVNLNHFTVQCDHYDIAGFEAFGLQNNCSVQVADVNGAFVPNTNVSLLTEAGGVPLNVAIATEAQGGVGQFIYTTECPFPRDVAPLPGEFFVTDAGFFDKCVGASDDLVYRTRNPRDGRATLVAYTLGEECYQDLNGNGVYDPGEFEARCDQSDPYVDENDDGMWNPACPDPNCDPMNPAGEPYVPSPNGDGGFQVPNGEWDSHRLIWRSVAVVWTDVLAVTGTLNAAATNGIYTPTTTSNGNWGTLACGSTNNTVTLQFSDANGNAPASVGAGDNIAISATNASIVGSSSIEDIDFAAVLNNFETAGTVIPPYMSLAPLPTLPLTLATLQFQFDTAACDAGYPDAGSPSDFEIDLTFNRTLGDQADVAGANLNDTTTVANVAYGQLSH